MQQAIEDVTLAWVCEYDLRSRRRALEEIDRSVADPVATAMIAAWAFGKREADTMPDESPDTPRDRSEEHTSDPQSLMRISYAVFCLTHKTKTNISDTNN